MSHGRKRSWVAKMLPEGSKGSTLATSLEGEEGLIESSTAEGSLPTNIPLQPSDSPTDLHLSSGSPSSFISPKRWSGHQQLLTAKNHTQHDEASQLIINALERTTSEQQAPLKAPEMSNTKGSFGKMSFTSMIGGLSSLSLSRTSTIEEIRGREKEKDRERGRSMAKNKTMRSSSAVGAVDTDESRSRSRARSQSPFTFKRFRQREPSPTPQPLPMTSSDIDLSDLSPSVRPRNAFTDDPDSGDETVGEDTDDDDWSDEDLDIFDPVTERNTERNAIIEPVNPTGGGIDEDPDPLGEGVNVVVPPEPYFPSTLNHSNSAGRGKRNPRRRKSTRHHDPLPIVTSRPVFKRDRCTLTLTQGDPDGKLGDRRRKRYVVASDLSEEARYAVEWGIGTVLRDGDEMLIVTITENENKVDPAIPNAADRATKIRSQQERQGLAYILVRQATSLLQRTKLNVIVSCQAWHAKNARHMLLDVVDYHEPTMLIVGSRGLGQLKGILLGSTSHYLIEKCSVPVMVARRRLKRPPKRSAHLSKDRVHVSLAEAGIDRVVPKALNDVDLMREEIERDDNQQRDAEETIEEDGDEDDLDGEAEEKAKN